MGDSHRDECRTLLYICRSSLRLLGNTEGLDSFFSLCCCSVTQLCPNLWDSMDCSTPGFLVHHQLPELSQTHVLRVGDAIQPSHLCCPLLLLPSMVPRIRVFSNELVLRIRWSNNLNYSFSISPSNEYSVDFLWD